MTHSATFDLDERITQINAGTVMTRAYAYDTRDLITSNGVRTFGYDAVGRLTHAQPSTGPATDYTYDSNGNRLTLTYGAYSENYAYNPQSNRLYQVSVNNNGTPSTRTIARNPRGETTLDSNLFSATNLIGDDFQFNR